MPAGRCSLSRRPDPAALAAWALALALVLVRRRQADRGGAFLSTPAHREGAAHGHAETRGLPGRPRSSAFLVTGIRRKARRALLHSGQQAAIAPSGVEGLLPAYAAPLLAIAAATVALLRASVIIIREGECALVERLGRFDRELKPGLHLKIPLVDSVRATMTVREQVLDIPPQSCITSDNAPLKADAVVYWRIFDPQKAVYSVDRLVLAIQNLVLTQLRAEIGKLTLDETFSARESLNAVLLKDVDVATDPWGVKITRVEVRDIIPNSEILASMEMQMAAERTKRAQVIQSEGQKQALLNEASGQAEAQVLKAQGLKTTTILKAEAEKERLLREAEGLASAVRAVTEETGDAEQALRLQLFKAYIDAQAQVAASPNAKVLMFPSAEEIGVKGSAVLGELQGAALGAELRGRLAAAKD
mmetsp:Transcript_28756/g.89443  ORF Transcript_28756/g.89443 Transcript_28756/m.89443 type:complete len:418 (-) Transcript_28756:15-1268(-)